MSKSVRIDPKGRLRIPANALASLRGCTKFFITSEDGESARVYPLRIWNEVEKRLADTHRQTLLIRAKYFGQAVTMDKQGRVLIPVALRETMQIKGEVDVLGFSKYLEVWNHTSFLKSLKRGSRQHGSRNRAPLPIGFRFEPASVAVQNDGHYPSGS
jgi:MraZ protein